LFIIILIFGEQILEFINLSSKISVHILYIIPAGAFLINIGQGFNYWLIRKKKYRNVSVNKLIRRGTEGGSQISFALYQVPVGLIISDIIGQIANAGATLFQVFRNGFKISLISRQKLRYVSGKYSEFPKFNLIPAFMSTYSFALPPLIINKFFSAENAGFFDASKNVLSIPLAFIAVSVSNVLLQKIAGHFNQKQSFLLELKPVFYIILLIGIVEILVISFFGPVLFSIVFGKEYFFSGEISRIMVWSFVLNFFISSFSCIFYSMRKIKTYSIWQAFYFLAIVSLVFFKDTDFVCFLKVYVCIEVFCFLILIIIMTSVVMKYEKSVKDLTLPKATST
jgi:O-antigen/teichoic acid export membrane protein